MVSAASAMWSCRTWASASQVTAWLRNLRSSTASAPAALRASTALASKRSTAAKSPVRYAARPDLLGKIQLEVLPERHSVRRHRLKPAHDLGSDTSRCCQILVLERRVDLGDLQPAIRDCHSRAA